jgi:hypothetical protein
MLGCVALGVLLLAHCWLRGSAVDLLLPLLPTTTAVVLYGTAGDSYCSYTGTAVQLYSSY